MLGGIGILSKELFCWKKVRELVMVVVVRERWWGKNCWCGRSGGELGWMCCDRRE